MVFTFAILAARANKNVGSFIRQYLTKGTCLSVHSEEELDTIALELSMRLRERFDFRCLIEGMSELMVRHHASPSGIQWRRSLHPP